MTFRILILCTCLLAGAGMLAREQGPSTVPPRDSLSNLPMEIGPWKGRVMGELSDNARDMLQVSDYTSRSYSTLAGASIGLYIGYHAAGGFHSPLNCLPGSGWSPIEAARLDLAVNPSPVNTVETSIRVNRITVLKGIDKQVVLYWYQGCGRVTASEYWGMICGMIDKMRLGRTDGALVRINSPAESLEPAAEAAAESNAVDFARSIYPLLSRYIPD